MGQIDAKFIFITISFILLLAIVAKLIILNRQQKENPAIKASHSHPNPVADNEAGFKRKNKIIFLIFGVGLVAGIVAYTFFKNIKGGEDGDTNSSIASMIPIWVAVFIPIMANKKNKKVSSKMSSEQRRNFFIIFFGIALFVAAIIILFFKN